MATDAEKKRQRLTDKILATIRDKYGSDAAMRMGAGGARSECKHAIPTGIDAFDNYVLGTGGFPAGRMTEVYSEEGAGKTSLILAGLAGVQRLGGLGFIAETEHSLQPSRAKTLGANMDDAVLVQPDSLEELLGELEVIVDALPDDVPAFIGWDSVAATATAAEVEGGVADDKQRMAEFARVMGAKFKLLIAKVAAKRVAFVCVNQLRLKIGITYGSPETTPGGSALKFYATTRVAIRGGQTVKEGATVVGKDVLLKTVKNKLVPPFRECRARLLYETGWDNRWTTINHAKELDLIPASTKTNDAGFAAAVAALEASKGWYTGPVAP